MFYLLDISKDVNDEKLNNMLQILNNHAHALQDPSKNAKFSVFFYPSSTSNLQYPLYSNSKISNSLDDDKKIKTLIEGVINSEEFKKIKFKEDRKLDTALNALIRQMAQKSDNSTNRVIVAFVSGKTDPASSLVLSDIANDLRKRNIQLLFIVDKKKADVDELKKAAPVKNIVLTDFNSDFENSLPKLLKVLEEAKKGKKTFKTSKPCILKLFFIILFAPY